MDEVWPLVGRTPEIALVERSLRDEVGVVIAGPAGVGKSRLAREAATIASALGHHLETVVATDAATVIPLGAFAHLDQGSTGDEDPVFATPFAALRRRLLERAGGLPLLLLVDDAHSLDAASAALVHQLVVARDALVVVTLRSRSAAPDAVVALWKDDLCTRLELQELSALEVGELLERVLGGPVDARSAHDLWHTTQGNLFFLRELVRDGLTTGALAFGPGRWRWTGAHLAPTRVTELLAGQLAALGPEERTALELVALGEPLEWDLLAELVPSAAVEAAIDAGLLVTNRAECRLEARLSHPLVGDVVCSLLTEPRRRSLLRSLASAVAATGTRRRTDVLREVAWLVDAGDEVDAISLTEAARRCVLVDGSMAERLARRALDAGGGVGAAVVLAQHLMFTRRAADADKVLGDAASAVTDPDDLAVLAMMRANNLVFGLGRAEEAVAVLDELRPTASPAMARALDAQAVPLLLFAGRVDEAAARGEASLADPATVCTDRIRVTMTLVPTLALRGRPVTAAGHGAAAFELLGAGNEALPFAAGQIASGLVLAHYWSGELDAGETLARFGYDEGTSRGIDLLRGVSALYLGIGARWRGRVRMATAYLREAVDALGETDIGFLGWAVDELRASAALAGVPEGAPEPEWRHALHETERLRLEGVAAAARGDRRRAIELGEEACAAARRGGMRIQAALALFDVARHGDAASAAPRLVALASGIEGRLIPTLSEAATALTAGDGAALDATAGALEEMGYLLYAAEAARAAARAFHRVGLLARERAADRRADRLGACCEGAETPLLLDRPAVAAAALTARERDVARLAADGDSNAEIARRLGISVRTAETHLQRAYAKLGVHDRGELRSALDA